MNNTGHELREDCFVVFVRSEPLSEEHPEELEKEEIVCSSHEEAERLRMDLHRHGRECVVRYIGPAGGGD